MKKIIINKEMIFPAEVNIFYEVAHATSAEGYERIKNGSNIYECRYSKDLKEYRVVEADNEGDYIIIELEECSDFDNAYLDNEALELQCTINNDKIKIESSCTTFINVARHYSIDTAEAITDYKKLIKLCKANNIKLSYKNHYKKFLEDNEINYIDEVQNGHEIFDKLIEAAKQVQKRGIHIGCSSDMYLNNMHDIQHKYEKLFYRSTVISQYEEIANTIHNYVQDIQNGHTSYIKIFL